MSRLLLLMPLLLAACATPPGGTAPEARDSRLQACRAEATRQVQWRDRGQTMRSDETESGRGTITVAPYSRAESDRLGAQVERDRLVADCMAGTQAGRPR